MAVFYRTRHFRGKEYWYREERWREGKKMRSRSTYLGPAAAAGSGGGNDSGGSASNSRLNAEREKWAQRIAGAKLDARLRPNTFERRHAAYPRTDAKTKARADFQSKRAEMRVEDEKLNKERGIVVHDHEQEIFDANWRERDHDTSGRNYEEYAGWANSKEKEGSSR